jgi:magnesium chelatase family protein
MSLAVVMSRALVGIQAPQVLVEVHLGPGLPTFAIVGLADTEVREARERVRAALNHARFDFPARRVTVNLAPADLPKDSSRLDLPIALGILAASGQISAKALQACEFVGELSLTGELRPVRGALAMALASRDNRRAFVLPAASAAEACLARGATVLPARSLLEVCAHLKGEQCLEPATHGATGEGPVYPDLADVRGQMPARRALEVAAAGGHSILLVGPPGTGKSMLASRFPGLLPPLEEAEALEVASIQSSVGQFQATQWGVRPYRAPHHTASAVSLVGGGGVPRPGEISLAHHGVLFLDELPEYPRSVLETLREPMESGVVSIARAARQARFPAAFQLIAAMNPCPCGYLGHPNGRCRCTPDAVSRYRGRLSGPLADRIDIKLEVPAVEAGELVATARGESSASVRQRVCDARRVQRARQEVPNARLAVGDTERHCSPGRSGEALLRHAIERLSLSARAYQRILRVARSIADLADAASITEEHVAEAIQYRRMDAGF